MVVSANKLFFRYRPDSELSIKELSNGEVYFASPKELNDSSEAKPYYLFKCHKDAWYRFWELLTWEIEKLLSKYPEYTTIVRAILGEKLQHNIEKLCNCFWLKIWHKKIDFINLFEYIGLTFKDFCQSNISKQTTNNLCKILEKSLLEIKKELDKDAEYYSLSFTRNPQSPAMWGHYSNSAKGYCLIFYCPTNNFQFMHTLPSFISRTPKDKNGTYGMFFSDKCECKLKPVLYKNNKPSINAFEYLYVKFNYSEVETHYNVLESFRPKCKYDLKNYGYIKHSDWKYEKEFRCILPFSIKEFSLPEDRCMIYNPKQLVGVIFGDRVQPEKKERIIEAVHIMRKRNCKLFGLPYDNLGQVHFFQANNKFSAMSTPFFEYPSVLNNFGRIECKSQQLNNEGKHILNLLNRNNDACTGSRK